MLESEIGPGEESTGAPAGKYTCPMHPEVISDQPGACPICGMALEPMAPSTADGGSTLNWTI